MIRAMILAIIQIHLKLRDEFTLGGSWDCCGGMGEENIGLIVLGSFVKSVIVFFRKVYCRKRD